MGLKRKVVEINGSYYVALPKSWAKAYGITKGSIVDMEVTDVVVIKPQNDRSMSTGISP